MKLKISILLIIYSFFITTIGNSLENKILFKVNNEIITSLDIFNELKYLGIINEKFKNTNKKDALEISKKSLIREKIKEIELKKIVKEIKIEDKFLNKVLLDNFKKIGINSISEFEDYFTQIEIDPNLIKKKISIEILWNQLIFQKYSQSVKINKQNIINNYKKSEKKKEFLLYEILFNVDENEKVDDKFNLIKDKIRESNFSEAALMYSISDSANKGGELGWISETTLSEEISKKLEDIQIGDFSNMMVIPGGFLILKIQNIREVENNFDRDKEIEKIIREKTNEQLNQFSNIFFNKSRKDVTINEL